jgi:hypothetical protein
MSPGGSISAIFVVTSGKGKKKKNHKAIVKVKSQK